MLAFSKKSRNKRILPTFPSIGSMTFQRRYVVRHLGRNLSSFFPSVFRRPEVDGSLKERELEIGKSEETR